MRVEPDYGAVSESQAASEFFPRTLLLVLLLVCAVLLAGGLVTSWLFKKVDDEYSKLLAATATDLNRAQDIAFHACLGYANLMQLPLTHDRSQREELLKAMAVERAANDQVFESLEKAVTEPDLRACLKDIQAKRLMARKESEILKSWTPEAGPLNWQPMMQAFVNYQRACDKLSEVIQAKSLKVSQVTTKEVTRFRLIIMILFGLSFLALALALVVIFPMLYLIWKTLPEGLSSTGGTP